MDPASNQKNLQTFCTALEIKNTTSSPHYHERNERAERAIQTIKQILKKCSSDVETIMAILAYLDTPVSKDLLSPAELFFNRRINTRLGLMYQPKILTDTQKTKLSEQRGAHLAPSKAVVRDEYVPDQLIWFTEDGCPEWKPGHIESRDVHPDSYWIINAESTRRLRRNQHDIKPCYSVPKLAPTINKDIVPFYRQQLPENDTEQNTPPLAETPKLRATGTPTEIPISDPITLVPVETTTSNKLDTTSCPKALSLSAVIRPVTTRYGRQSKSNRDLSFVYSGMRILA